MSSIIGIKFKQPNSAIRKCARFQLIKNGKNLLTLQDGCLNYIEDGDVDVIAGFRRKSPL
jgi:ribosomal protein S12